MSRLNTLLASIGSILIPPHRQALAPTATLSEILDAERERILTALLRAVIVLGFTTLIIIMPAAIRENLWPLLIIYCTALALTAIVTFNRQLPYEVRAGTFLILCYSLGVVDLVSFGLAEDGRIYLFSFSLATALLLGTRVGVGALLLSVVTIGLVGSLISTGQFNTFYASHIPSDNFTLDMVIISCMIFLLLVGLVLAAIQGLWHSFEISWQRERESMHALVMERDLLEQRVSQRTQELEVARDRALALSQQKSDLLSKVSHELRTPINAVLGYAEMLYDGVYGPLAEQQEKPIDEIMDSSHYLTRLVSDLLDQAHLEAGKLKLTQEPVNLAEIIDKTQAQMQVLAQNKGLGLTSHISAEVPPIISGDTIRLQQILVNLIGNAIKFTPRGQVQISLSCPDEGHLAIQVSDTGVGIPLSAKSRIFEAFEQIEDEAAGQQRGTGLGLSIVKQLATLMGGTVYLESQVGQGSLFTILLPLVPLETIPSALGSSDYR